jgi:hypothetical protein
MITSKRPRDKEQELGKGTNATNASALVRDSSIHNAEPINKIKVRPQEQQHISLGNFTVAKPPKGFSVGVDPDPDPAGSVASEITSQGTPSRYELILHLVNYGDKTVTAKVWQL